MTAYDLSRVRLAVQFLVDSPYFHQHTKKLTASVSRPRALPFRGQAEVLNELILVGRQNLQALTNLLHVAEHKRDDRNEYQRQYMAAKRQRDRKALLLEEILEGRKLPHDYRVRILHKQYVVWNKERDQFIKSLGDVSWTERNVQLRTFWERKEAELDELVEEARKRGPVVRKRKRVIVATPPEPKSHFGQKLAGALKNR